MKRKLFFLERFIYGDGHLPFNAVLTVKINGSPSLENLQQALTKVQARHPLLRSRIVKDKRDFPWFTTVDQPPAIPVNIVNRTSDDDWLLQSRHEWVTPFDMDQGPLIRMVWLQSPSVSDLLMVFHHSICNGGSAVCLMQEILSLWDRPNLCTGKEMDFITPEKLLAGITVDRATRRKARLQSLMALMILSIRSAFINRKNGPSLSRGKDYAINWKLDKAASSALFDFCRDLNITVNTALCAAFLTAFQSVRGSDKYDKITCPVDIRKYLPALQKDDLFAFAMAITLPMEENKEESIWDRAVKMQKDASEKMGKLNAAEYLVPMEYAHATLRPLLKLLRYSKPGFGLLFSNMGRLEINKQYDTFEVGTVYSPTVIGPFGDPTGIVTTTFDGKMDFCFLSNEDCVPYADALTIRQKAMESLFLKLDV
ncbi:MAG TPA: condensation domain-containing protein [Puia sp.]|nr:condensation domain-containing protein [Puia sp.]